MESRENLSEFFESQNQYYISPKKDRTIKTRYRPSLISLNSAQNSKFSTIDSQNHIDMKFVILGDCSVGKTSILRKLKNEATSQSLNKVTISVDFHVMTFQIDEKGTLADIFIWDTCGSEKYLSITKSFFKGITGIVLVYDISQRSSFDSLSMWIAEIEDNLDNRSSLKAGGTATETPILIVGNKCDIIEREVSFIEASNWCYNRGYSYIESSALNGYNISKIFEELADEVVKKDGKLKSIKDEKSFHLSESTLNKSKLAEYYRKNDCRNSKNCC